MSPEEHAARVTPEACLESARRLLECNDPEPLVADLLRQLREMDQLRDVKRDRYGRYFQERWDEHQRVRDERNWYREALREVKRAVRNVRVGR